MLKLVNSYKIEILILALLALIFLVNKDFVQVPFFNTYAGETSPYSDECPKCCLGGESPRLVANGHNNTVFTCDSEVGMSCNGVCEEIPPYSEWMLIIE